MFFAFLAFFSIYLLYLHFFFALFFSFLFLFLLCFLFFFLHFYSLFTISPPIFYIFSLLQFLISSAYNLSLLLFKKIPLFCMFSFCFARTPEQWNSTTKAIGLLEAPHFIHWALILGRTGEGQRTQHMTYCVISVTPPSREKREGYSCYVGSIFLYLYLALFIFLWGGFVSVLFCLLLFLLLFI